MEIDKLTLLAGKPIPCPDLRASIHQPTLNDIAMIGEKTFYEYLGVFKTKVEDVIESMSTNLPKEKV